MKLLDTLHESDVITHAIDVDPSHFIHREATRAIVINPLGAIALLKVGAHNYHKLPGGGIEEGEEIKQALARELLEEIGCIVEITDEVGEVIEYRDQYEMKQTSYCYIGKQIGEVQDPDFTEKEIADEMSIIWAANIDEAILLLEQDQPMNYTGEFIVKRDLQLLRAAKALIEQTQ